MAGEYKYSEDEVNFRDMAIGENGAAYLGILRASDGFEVPTIVHNTLYLFSSFIEDLNLY